MNKISESLFNLVKNGLENEVKIIASQIEDKSVKDNNGWTALFWACAQGNLQIFKFLADLGWSVHDTDNNGRSIFDIATGAKRHAIAEYLKRSYPTAFADVPYINRYSASLNGNDLVLTPAGGDLPIDLQTVLYGNDQ